jgi:hypothetical protein
MKIREKAHVLQLKKRFNNDSLVDGLPEEFLLFMKHLQGLKYGNLPDYELLKGLLMRVCENNGYKMDDLYDWQKSGSSTQSSKDAKSTSSRSTNHVSRSIPQTSAQEGGDNFYNIVQQPDKRPKNNAQKNEGKAEVQESAAASSGGKKKGCRCTVQ